MISLSIFSLLTRLSPICLYFGPLAIAGIGALGSIAGGLIGSSGQKDANATNLRIAREQMTFQERMSNTAIQRGIADYRAAGLNPMLAGMNPASTPAGSTTRVENSKASIGQGVSNAVSSAASALTAQNIQAQNQLLQAQTDKTRAEASVVQATVPYSASNARLESFKLENEVSELAQRVQSTIKDVALKDVDLAIMRPLLIEYQKIQNEAQRLGIPAAQAQADFYKQLGSNAKYIELFQKFLPYIGPR